MFYVSVGIDGGLLGTFERGGGLLGDAVVVSGGVCDGGGGVG